MKKRLDTFSESIRQSFVSLYRQSMFHDAKKLRDGFKESLPVRIRPLTAVPGHKGIESAVVDLNANEATSTVLGKS